MSESPRPLAGLRVLEFGHTIMGPCAGMVLADLGADVVKVEPAPHGDRTRTLPGMAAGFFTTFNRNKRSIALDLKTPDGQAAAHRLVTQADIVVENFGPGTMERLGCGWDDLSKINPRLIYLALKGFLAGPYEHRAALDEVVQFQAGLAYMTGPPGRPLRAGASVIDILGAVFGITAVLAALRERDTTGKGQRIGSALFESAVFLMGSHMAGGVAVGQPVPPMPARLGAWGVYDVFSTVDDRQFFLGLTSDAHWKRFCTAFQVPSEIADNPRLADNTGRVAQRDWLIPRLSALIAPLTLADATGRCEAEVLPWAPVGRPDDLFNDPHLLSGGGLLQTMARAVDGLRLVGLPALPVEFGRDRPGLVRQPPGVGEHGRELLAEAGYTSGEIAGLIARGALVAGSPLR